MSLLRRWAGVLVVLACAAGFARAEDPDKLPKPTTYVVDLAGVLDASSTQSLQDLSTQLYTQAHATLEVVTIKSLDGLTIEEFTTRLDENWKVGPKGTDKGAVMIFAVAEHKYRIEVGYGLEGILNDAKVGDIGRTMVPQLKAGEYGPAALGGAQQVADVIAKDAGVSLAPAPVHTYHREQTRSPSMGIFGWIKIILLVLFVLGILSRGGRGGGGGLGWFLLGNFLGGSGRGGGWGGGGGGDRGGDSGGGGGGDFGGGFGGDSGGGGASGDW